MLYTQVLACVYLFSIRIVYHKSLSIALLIDNYFSTRGKRKMAIHWLSSRIQVTENSRLLFLKNHRNLGDFFSDVGQWR